MALGALCPVSVEEYPDPFQDRQDRGKFLVGERPGNCRKHGTGTFNATLPHVEARISKRYKFSAAIVGIGGYGHQGTPLKAFQCIRHCPLGHLKGVGEAPRAPRAAEAHHVVEDDELGHGQAVRQAPFQMIAGQLFDDAYLRQQPEYQWIVF